MHMVGGAVHAFTHAGAAKAPHAVFLRKLLTSSLCGSFVSACCPMQLVFHINYLGTDQASITLNFSRGASHVM